MEQEQEKLKSITISEIYSSISIIQTQLNKLSYIFDKLSSENEEFKNLMPQIDKFVREMNLSEMRSHGDSTEKIVDWYCSNYPYESILVTTPNGDHPIDYSEWCVGRRNNNKEVDPEYYKDYMQRVIDKGGYIQTIPF